MEKCDRILVESRVRVLCSDELSAYVLVNGDHADYHVSVYRDADGLVRECECPYHKFHPSRDCSHVLAVLKIWNPEGMTE